jgi:DNA polymerase-3 subunit gamma/tau
LQLKPLPANGGASLKIEQPKVTTPVVPVPNKQDSAPLPTKSGPAPLPTQPVYPAPPPSSFAQTQPQTETRRPGGLLEVLRQKQQAEAANRKAKQVRQPEIEEVKEIWAKYSEDLKAQQKHSAVTSFSIARLEVSGNEVTIKSVSTINQKFIEMESTNLLEKLKDQFFNTDIKIRFVMEEDTEAPQRQLEPKYMTSQERFRMMAEQFPLVRELKERLKLEIKY